MLERRLAHERGTANFGWLNSHHSFSFGSYYDPAHMGHSALRVINDDSVEPGAGFGTHGHRDMEIISFVTQGTMEHKDSMGNVQVLPQGEFQLMSAGRGITHSEYNASPTEKLKFLQIWIVPESQGGEPGYQQKRFTAKAGLTPIITPEDQAKSAFKSVAVDRT
jgi:quercetin 2,3-dioxygenase